MIKQYLQNLPEDFKKEKEKIYVAVIGGRDVEDYQFLCDKFLTFIQISKVNIEDITFVSGGARGVDRMARKLAQELEREIIEIIPDWETLGKISLLILLTSVRRYKSGRLRSKRQ